MAMGFLALSFSARSIAHDRTHAELLVESQAAPTASMVVSSWKDLPDNIREIFRGHGIRSMSDSHGPFDATDSGSHIDTDNDGRFVVRRPSRIRLLFAVQTETVWLISYETGGIAHSYHLVEIRLTPDSTTEMHYLLGHKVSRGTLASSIAAHDYAAEDNWHR